MFDTPEISDTKPIAILKKGFVVIIIALLGIGAVSSYRAYVQVRSLEISADRQLKAGSNINVSVTASGRTPVDVRIELIQGSNSETLFVMHVPDNELAFFDPRTQHEAKTEVITNEQLAGFQNGAATLRATATGRPQWTRLPPPTVREVTLEIRR